MGKKEVLTPFKGTRDISGDDMRFRQWVVSTIREVYELYGFEPLETPVIERMRTLQGKYGAEAENLLFRLGEPHVDGGLRYDHTVPLARFAAANWNELPKPYRRYAIGPVFRAENPQKGRYRQFWQCDFDTIGSKSLGIDAEIVAITYTVLTRLGFTDQFVTQVNDRTLLNAMAEELGFTDPSQVILVLRAWDKLDKQTSEDVLQYLAREMEPLGISLDKLESGYQKVTLELLALQQSPLPEVLSYLREKFTSAKSVEALNTIESLMNNVASLGVPEGRYVFNPLLARGLSYYTGPIFETVVKEGGIGSVTGGGRFDNLIEAMGGPDVPATGSSFGLDRLLVVMELLGLRPETSQTTVAFVTFFDQDNQELVNASLSVASSLRTANVPTEVYGGEKAKLGKQLDQANRKSIRFAIIVGPDELSNNVAVVKDLTNRSEEKVSISDVGQYVSDRI